MCARARAPAAAAAATTAATATTAAAAAAATAATAATAAALALTSLRSPHVRLPPPPRPHLDAPPSHPTSFPPLSRHPPSPYPYPSPALALSLALTAYGTTNRGRAGARCARLAEEAHAQPGQG